MSLPHAVPRLELLGEHPERFTAEPKSCHGVMQYDAMTAVETDIVAINSSWETSLITGILYSEAHSKIYELVESRVTTDPAK